MAQNTDTVKTTVQHNKISLKIKLSIHLSLLSHRIHLTVTHLKDKACFLFVSIRKQARPAQSNLHPPHHTPPSKEQATSDQFPKLHQLLWPDSYRLQWHLKHPACRQTPTFRHGNLELQRIPCASCKSLKSTQGSQNVRGPKELSVRFHRC